MRPFISLCMIVKNEEKVIDRCLSSIAHLVDEIVIVDTGSTDVTKELASQYTEHLYDLEWIDDFSYARNFAASKASGEWIIALDADEYVDEENFKLFITELKKDGSKFNAYSVKIINFTGNNAENMLQNHHDRIYRNNGDIAYGRKVHEQFQSQNGQPIRFKTASLVIFHSGYLNYTVAEKNKQARNKKLIESEMTMSENKAFDYFNLANEKMAQAEYENALENYIKAYQLKSDNQLSWVPACVIQIVLCLIQLKKFNNAIEVINDSGNVYWSSPEFLYLKGEVFYLRGQFSDAKNIFKQIIENKDLYPDIILRPDFKEQMPSLRLGEIFLFEEKFQEAIQYFIQVLNINKNNTDAIDKMMYILLEFHTEEEISQFLKGKQLVSNKNIKAYLRVCFRLGALQLAMNLIEKFQDENILLYKLSLLKAGLVLGEVKVDEIEEILLPEILGNLNNAEWLNIVDLYLLSKLSDQDKSIEKTMQSFKEEQTMKQLISILEEQKVDGVIQQDLFIASLYTFISYKQIHYVNQLLSQIEKLDKETIAKSAAILFSNGFKAEGMHLYDQTDWSCFDAQDYLNIIQSLKQTGHQEYAINVAESALNVYKDDMRFYQFIFDNSNDYHMKNRIGKQAKVQFGESEYLNKVLI